MDASSCTKESNTDMCSYYLKIESCEFPATFKHQRNPVVKYTKLPDFDFDTNVSWPQQSYTLHPRLRRIIDFQQDPSVLTTRSLKHDTTAMAVNYSKRKIVTIIEDDESILSHKISKEPKRPTSVRVTHKSIGTDSKEDKRSNVRSGLRPNTVRYSKDTKSLAKVSDISSNTSGSKESTALKSISKNKTSHNNSQSKAELNAFNQKLKEKETTRYTQRINVIPKSNVRKKTVVCSESENEIYSMKNKLNDAAKITKSPKNYTERPRSKKSNLNTRNSLSFWEEIKPKTNPIVINTPLEGSSFPEARDLEVTQNTTVDSNDLEININTVNCATEVDNSVIKKDANVETEKIRTVNQETMINLDLRSDKYCEAGLETSVLSGVQNKETFLDDLDIPNVTLMKDVSKENLVSFCSKSLPNLRIPAITVTPKTDDTNTIHPKLSKNTSLVIGRATLTYTTRQKINIQVLSNTEETTSSPPTSPLTYPMNVVSVYKRKTEKSKPNNDNINYECTKSKIIFNHDLNEGKYFKCRHEFNDQLIKPSDIISSINMNRPMLRNDYVSEQFQRELNFIDSFFESLQYLESSTLSEKCLFSKKCDYWFSSSEFVGQNLNKRKFLPKLENSENIEDTETMVSKSLCLLNLLIHDEQRRAKNLLFVLKMREDALKDFTKSHILWLENKKKQDSTDISALKKKQRGALLKLQFECGEMQRMRKALLSLSEKRKAALMKTKKNIELKLKKNIDVDQIILGKKKLKRSLVTDRTLTPLKCFDLSSSECDDSSTSRTKSAKSPITAPENDTPHQVASVEKCIQTCDSVLQPVLVSQENHVAAENFVVVDGGYLNILFNNLALPQIFSNGKQYEVNEEALKNIVNTTNSQQENVCENEENLMGNLISEDELSSPSTAHSLVEEFDLYYKALVEDKASEVSSLHLDNNPPAVICEVKDQLVQASEVLVEKFDQDVLSATVSDSSGTVVGDEISVSSDPSLNNNKIILEEFPNVKNTLMVESQSSDFVMPVVDTVLKDLQIPEIHIQTPSTLSSKSSLSAENDVFNEPDRSCAISITSLNSPVHTEAEELRRQQLEIEREIQALEQQQNQLLVVREIPDKPPPPYTPPTESKSTKHVRKFVIEEITLEKVQKHIIEPAQCSEPTDIFDIFVKDYCLEAVDRQQLDVSDNPWDSCNLLPKKPELEPEKLVDKTLSDLKDVLTCVPPTVVSGVSNRRSDHIDDILFTEWRRYEPEWTTLHVDEATIKNQVFESIFQKVLTETIDQYKKTVLGITSDGENVIDMV